MFQQEAGSGSPLVLLHGNPSSSHVFRNVMPWLAGRARCIAPDLVGMGRSGKPRSGYRFADHARYLDAWFGAHGLRDVVLVGYDWGGVLALDWASRHPDRVRGVVVFETFLRPMHWSDWPPAGAELFRALRTPGVGEHLVLDQNAFLDRSLSHGVQSGLSAADRAVYAARIRTPSPAGLSCNGRGRSPSMASRPTLRRWSRATPSFSQVTPSCPSYCSRSTGTC